MCPITHASFLSLAVAVFAGFIFGFLWYGPIFGKTWAHLMGLKMGDGKMAPWAIPLTVFGTFLTTMVLAYFLNTFKPGCRCSAAFFIWLGFYLPPLFSYVAWEGKPWMLLLLNASYFFLQLQLIAAILTVLH